MVGKALKDAVATFGQLSLKSRQELHDEHPPLAAQRVPAIPHLDVQDGWYCSFCEGEELTTSRFVRDESSESSDESAGPHGSEDPPTTPSMNGLQLACLALCIELLNQAIHNRE